MIFKISTLKNKNFLALTGNLVISGFSVITMSLLYRAFSKSDAGTWFFFLSIQSLAEAFRGGLLSTAAVKFYAGTEKKIAETVIGTIWLASLAITCILLIGSIIGICFIKYITNYQLIIVLKWIGITFVSSLSFTVPIWVLMADENYAKILWLRLVNSGSMFLTIIVLIYFKRMTLDNMLILNIATNVLTGIVCVLMGSFYIEYLFKSTKAKFIEILHFGKFTVSSGISLIFFRTFITIIITFFLSPTALAVYNLPGRLMTIIEIPLGSSLGTGMSAMATALNKNKIHDFKKIFVKYTGLLTFAILPIILFVLLFADYAVAIIGGPKYNGTEAANILRLMIFFSFLFPLDRFNGVALDLLHLPHINFQKILIMLSVNTIGGLLGLYFFHSLYGIAFFTPLTVISGVLFGYYALKKRMDYTIVEIIQSGCYETKNVFLKIKKSARMK